MFKGINTPKYFHLILKIYWNIRLHPQIMGRWIYRAPQKYVFIDKVNQ